MYKKKDKGIWRGKEGRKDGGKKGQGETEKGGRGAELEKNETVLM